MLFHVQILLKLFSNGVTFSFLAFFNATKVIAPNLICIAQSNQNYFMDFLNILYRKNNNTQHRIPLK